MPNIVSPEQRRQNLDIFQLREFMTAEEQAEIDHLIWSPEKERQRYRDNPPAFAREVLGMDLAPYQERVLWKLYQTKRVAFKGPRGAGKSTVATAAILWFLAVFDECKVPTTASAWRQLINFLWPEIHKWATKAEWWRVGLVIRPGKELLAQSLEVNQSQNRAAFAMASNNEDRVEGGHSAAVLVILDEAKAIPDVIWDSIEGTLNTGEEMYALALSTPGDNIGRFRDLYIDREKYRHWTTESATLDECTAAGRISKSWAELMATQWGTDSVMYKRHVLGEFAEDAGDTLITYEQCQRAINRWDELERDVQRLVADGMDSRSAEQQIWGDLSHIGVDPARFGADKTGWAFRYGDRIRRIERTDKQDTMETADKAHYHLQGNTAVANIDTNGLGAGVYDRLRQLWQQKQLRKPHDIRLPIISINVTNATKALDKTQQLTFNRLRDYLWWHLRELFEDDVIVIPPDDELVRDLIAHTWSTTASGKVVIESKDEIRKKLNRSPDVGDAVALAMAPDAPPYKVAIGFI